MANAPDETSPERKQTDESLRVEREKADAALAENLLHVDENADAVITRARARADAVLAAARAKIDRKAPLAASAAVTKERGREDQVVQAERANADEVLREERAESVALLARERKETDKDLVRERDHSDEALATRDEFLAIVSHDLRTLLNQVMGFASLINMGLGDQKEGKQAAMNADRIQRAGVRMNRLIGDLVDVASIHAGKLTVTLQEPEDPMRAVLEAVDTFQAQAQSKGVAVVAESGPGPNSVAFDHARILQVLTNLMSNAIKFTPAQGKVIARVERTGTDYRFSVSDTGVGIAPEKLEAVIERYLQLAANDRRGVGLGLYISRCIIEGHGGRIWAESTLGKGSTFFFALPVHGLAAS